MKIIKKPYLKTINIKVENLHIFFNELINFYAYCTDAKRKRKIIKFILLIVFIKSMYNAIHY